MDNFDKTLEMLHSLITVNEKGETVLANPGEREVFCALIQSLPDEVAKAWLSSGEYCEYPMNYYLRGKIGYLPGRDLRSVLNLKRPISEVIAEFKDKKGGKRTKAKNELLGRFGDLNWKEQLLVFEAMLEAAVSYKSYREWVYYSLRTYFWSDLDNIQTGFKSRKVKPIKEQIIQLCTEHIDEFHPALFALKIFDLSYIQAHKDELIKAVDYFSVADRLMEDPEFIPQFDLLANPASRHFPWDEYDTPEPQEVLQTKHNLKCGKAYYYLMAKHGRAVDKREARDFMLKCIIFDDIKPSKQSPFEKVKDFSLMCDRDMYRLLMNFGRLGFSELIMEYHEMERGVQKNFEESVIKDECLWDYYLKLFREEALLRCLSEQDLQKLKEDNRLEYYKRLTINRLPIDEHEARGYLADLVRNAKSLTLDNDRTFIKTEEYTLRLNRTIDDLLVIFEQNGLNDVLKGFAEFEREVMYHFKKKRRQTAEDYSEAISSWNEFLETAESELYSREHAIENAKQFFASNPGMSTLLGDFDLKATRYDYPI